MLDYAKAGAASQAIQTVLENKTVAAADPTKPLLKISRLQHGQFKASVSAPPRAVHCAKVCRAVWGKSPMSTVPEFLLCRLFFQTFRLQNWGIFHTFMQLCFFTRSERAGEASRVLSSGGKQSQAKPLLAATGVYCLPPFQVVTVLSLLLNLPHFTVFRKGPHCSV